MNKLYFVLLCILLPAPAFAYLDPGTGGMLFSALIGIATTLFFMLKGLFHRLKYLPSILAGKRNIEKKHYEIVFYSEGKQYWNVFFPIIEELAKKGKQIAYFTSGKNDPGLEAVYDNYSAKFIGEGVRAFFFMNLVEADVVVMTTPGLDVFQLRRSKAVKHYVHIVHGMEDTSTYAPYGVDYFDSVLVNGEHQKAVIRELEQLRGLPEKKIEIIGSPYLDVLRKRIETTHNEGAASSPTLSKQKTILVAPSWGEKGFLTKFGKNLLDQLLTRDVRVIVRPHPQSLVAEKDFIDLMCQSYADHGNVEWDFASDGFESMRRAEVMISDFSGIIFDYIFLFSRPVLVANFALDPRKYDMASLSSRKSTLMSCIQQGRIGLVFEEGDVASIHELIDRATEEGDMSASIREIASRVYCHPGEAGIRGAAFLEKLHNECCGG